MIPRHLSHCLAFGLLLAGCTVVPETGRKQLIAVPIEMETSMGLEAFAQVKQSEKVSNDPKYNRQVQEIGRRIASSVGRDLPNAQWEFVVFESDQVNAFALPGGKVGVYTGLLRLASSDDEVACVVGHEIAHVSSRHSGERLTQQIGAALLTAGTAVLARDSQYRDVAMASMGAGSSLAILKFSRDHELEADSIGLRFAAGAGYDPRAAITFWQKMAGKNQGQEPPKWLSTHPPTTERIANLQRLAPEYLPLYEQSKRRFE
jgi:predicted Zn-dependent protease